MIAQESTMVYAHATEPTAAAAAATASNTPQDASPTPVSSSPSAGPIDDSTFLSCESSWRERMCYDEDAILALHKEINSHDFDDEDARPEFASPFGDLGFMSSTDPEISMAVRRQQQQQQQLQPSKPRSARLDAQIATFDTLDAPVSYRQQPQPQQRALAGSVQARASFLNKQTSIRRGINKNVNLADHFRKQEPSAAPPPQPAATSTKPEISSLIQQFQILLHEQQQPEKAKASKKKKNKKSDTAAVDVQTREQYKGITSTQQQTAASVDCSSSLASAASTKSKKSLIRKLHGVVRRRNSIGKHGPLGGHTQPADSSSIPSVRETADDTPVADHGGNPAASNTDPTPQNDSPNPIVGGTDGASYTYDEQASVGTMSLADASVGSATSTKKTKKKARRRLSGRFSKQDLKEQQQQQQEQQLKQLQLIQQQAKEREDEYLHSIEQLQRQNQLQQQQMEEQARQIELLRGLLEWKSVHELAVVTTEMTYYRQRYLDSTKQRYECQAKLTQAQDAVEKKQIHIAQLEHEVCKQEQKIIQLQADLIQQTMGNTGGFDSTDEDSFHFGGRDDDTAKSFSEDSLIGGTVEAIATRGSCTHNSSGNTSATRALSSSSSSSLRMERSVDASIGSSENTTPNNNKSAASKQSIPSGSLRSIESLSLRGRNRTITASGTVPLPPSLMSAPKSLPPSPPPPPPTPSTANNTSNDSCRSRRSSMAGGRKTPRNPTEKSAGSDKVQPVDCLPSQFQQGEGADAAFTRESPSLSSRKTHRKSRSPGRLASSKRYTSASSVSSGRSSRTNDTRKSKRKSGSRPNQPPKDMGILDGVAPPSSIRRSISIGGSSSGSLHRRSILSGLSSAASGDSLGLSESNSNHSNRRARTSGQPLSKHRHTRATSGSSMQNRIPPRRSISMTNAPLHSRNASSARSSDLDNRSAHSCRSMERKALIFSKLDGFLDTEDGDGDGEKQERTPASTALTPQEEAGEAPEKSRKPSDKKQRGQFKPTVPPSA